MVKEYAFHSDAGHAWLEVAIDEIKELGIENKITTYSYMNDGFVYLEEDVDASTFIKALKEKYGDDLEIIINEQYQERSFIRALPYYK